MKKCTRINHHPSDISQSQLLLQMAKSASARSLAESPAKINSESHTPSSRSEPYDVSNDAWCSILWLRHEHVLLSPGMIFWCSDLDCSCLWIVDLYTLARASVALMELSSFVVKKHIRKNSNNIKCTKYQNLNMFLVLACSYLCTICWNQALSGEWRCSWSSADRQCSNYIWVINNLIAY